jgi:type IV pilus assembly protein PilQ
MTKKNKKRMIVYLIVLGVIALCMTSAQAMNSTTKKSVITNISTVKLDDATEILIDSDNDLLYNLYKPADPYKVIIELSSVDLSSFTENIRIDDGGIVEIIPSVIDPEKGYARIEIILSEPALDVRHLQRDNSLVVLVSKPFLDNVDIVEELDIDSNNEVSPVTSVITQELNSEDDQSEGISEDTVTVEEASLGDTEAIMSGDKKKYTGKKISLDFQDADLIHIFRLLADISGYNIVIHPAVQGKIPNLKLLNVPWDQALDIILRNYGLDKKMDGNIIRVAPNAVFAKEYEEKAKAMEAEKSAEPLVTRVFRINYTDSKEFFESIKKDFDKLSPSYHLTLDERTSTLIVKAIPSAVEEIERILNTVDKQTPQVLIEARIVQISKSFRRALGIQWGAGSPDPATPLSRFGSLNLFGSGTGLGDLFREFTFGDGEASVIPLLVNFPASGAATALDLAIINRRGTFGLEMRLSAIEEGSHGRILSTPKVLTIDNKPAVLKEGQSVPYPVQSEDGVSTAYADVTTSLTVTPHITPEGAILLDLETKKIDLVTFVDLGSALRAPLLTDSQVLTKVLIRDGDTVVIGGMYRKSSSEAESKTPFLGRIPVLKWLFKNEDKKDEESEILYFITPRIVRKS